MEACANTQKGKWKPYGCIIICGRWIKMTKLDNDHRNPNPQIVTRFLC